MAGFDNLTTESDVPIRVPLFECVYMKTVVNRSYIERQQVVSGSRKKLNFIARLKYYLLGNHLKVQRHGAGGLVLESANNRVIFWRHGEGLVVAESYYSFRPSFEDATILHIGAAPTEQR